jgi:tetratricopeptide (TPR) repeat protein
LDALIVAGVSCPAPMDGAVVAILSAWNDGLAPGRARVALDRLDRLRRDDSAVAARLADTAARDVAIRAAHRAYDRGDLTAARRYMQRAAARGSGARVAHDLAALELAAGAGRRGGRLDQVIRALEAVAGEVPAALYNLGVARDRAGEPRRALDDYRRAKAAGIDAPGLDRRIQIKERLWTAGDHR